MVHVSLGLDLVGNGFHAHIGFVSWRLKFKLSSTHVHSLSLLGEKVLLLAVSFELHDASTRH